MRVLIIDDDPDFREFLTIGLEHGGVEYSTADSAEEGTRLLRESPEGSYDLVLLDIEMPGGSGWDVLLDIRESGAEIPVIFVAGSTKVEDRVKSLKLGADDHLVKPIEMDELIERINAVLRRRNSLTPIQYGDLRLDLARRKVDRGGHAVDLSPREYDLLYALVQAKGDLKSRDGLLKEVWDIEFDPGTNVLDVHVGRLRRKLDRFGRPLIETVRGKGYRLVRHTEGDTPGPGSSAPA